MCFGRNIALSSQKKEILHWKTSNGEFISALMIGGCR
jgi:hypothetical protein